MKQERDSDKLDSPTSKISLEDAVDIVGTCDMMCPEFESLQRYFERNLDHYEKSPTGGYDRSLMVMQYARAAAGNTLPPSEDIRPPPILRATIDYLFDKVMVEHGIEPTHNFLWNRTRAVRSDLTRQRDHSPDAIYCLERIVRYHILALHLVCRGEVQAETMEIEQLKKTLQSLMEVYHDARVQYTSPHEAEFRAYYILMHIRSRHAPFTLRSLPPSIYNSTTLQWALTLRFTLTRNTNGADEHNSDVTQMEYAGFFELLTHPDTSYLSACLLESHFDDIRRQICLMLGLTLKNSSRIVPIAGFRRLLHLDTEEDAVGWTSHLRWNLTADGFVEIPHSRREEILLPPIATATPFPRPKSQLVDAKRPVLNSSTGFFPGAIDSLITKAATTDAQQLALASLPRQRRPRLKPTTSIQYPLAGITVQPNSVSPFSWPPPQVVPTSKTSNIESFSTQSMNHATPKPVSNPFGTRLSGSAQQVPPPAPQTYSAFGIARAQPQTAVRSAFGALQEQSKPPAPFPSFSFPSAPPKPFIPIASTTNAAVLPAPSSSVFSFAPTPQRAGTRAPEPPPTTFVPPVISGPPPSAVLPSAFQSSQTSLSQIPATGPVSTPRPPSPAEDGADDDPTIPTVPQPTITSPIAITRLEQPPQHPEEQERPKPLSFAPSLSTSSSFTGLITDTNSALTKHVVPREGPRRHLSDGYVSGESSIRPPSTRGDEQDIIERPIHEPLSKTASLVSSANDSDIIDLGPFSEHRIDLDRNHISSLKSFVDKWRDTSSRSPDRGQDPQDILEKAEEMATQLPLGSHLGNTWRTSQKPVAKKRITEELDATQTFMMAEKKADDRLQVWAPKTFARLLTQTAKRRAPNRELPPGWQIWVSFVPHGSSSAEWLKIKLAGEANASDLSRIIAGPAPTEDHVAAPGLLVLHIEPGEWDENLRRAQELIDCLPDDSPYVPGLLLVMIAPRGHSMIPPTWISKLDRIVESVVLDRRAAIFNDMDSAHGLEATLNTHLEELKFDVEGRAPRLPLGDLVSEYMNWWNVEFEFGSEQALYPDVDLDITLLVISVLMSGLDEFLRQISLQCTTPTVGVPFNDFQSRRNLEGACLELLAYLKKIGGSFRRFPTTPAAIIQDPEIIFQLVSRIAFTVKALVLLRSDTLQPRPGLKRPLLEKLGREFNAKLEKELISVDRSSLRYSAPANISSTPIVASNLKRKRQSSTYTNGVATSSTSAFVGQPTSPSTAAPKRSRITIEKIARPASPVRMSFKVQMAKARLDLKVVQAVDLEKYSGEDELAAARAKVLSALAQPLIETVLKASIPSEQDVIECRAAIELMDGVQEPVLKHLSQNFVLARLINKLSALNEWPGSVEYRGLVSAASRLADHLDY